MLNLVFLPATGPGDITFGTIPDSIAGYPDASIRRVGFSRLVWYNEAVRKETIAQISAWDVAPIVLVGFSKSGLGAWNIARTIPDLVSATIIFDAPAARLQLPPWGTDAFYPDDAAWQANLPIRTIREFKTAMHTEHQLVLISGANFHDEMSALSDALAANGVPHLFLPCPDMKHHWNSGWIEVGLNILLKPDVDGVSLQSHENDTEAAHQTQKKTPCLLNQR